MAANAQRINLLRARSFDPHQHSKEQDARDGSHRLLRAIAPPGSADRCRTNRRVLQRSALRESSYFVSRL
jgi:hypothetical protein